MHKLYLLKFKKIIYFLQKTIDKLKVIGYTVIELRKGYKIRKIKTKGE